LAEALSARWKLAFRICDHFPASGRGIARHALEHASEDRAQRRRETLELFGIVVLLVLGGGGYYGRRRWF
jgi:hypothetical protein